MLFHFMSFSVHGRAGFLELVKEAVKSGPLMPLGLLMANHLSGFSVISVQENYDCYIPSLAFQWLTSAKKRAVDSYHFHRKRMVSTWVYPEF